MPLLAGVRYWEAVHTGGVFTVRILLNLACGIGYITTYAKGVSWMLPQMYDYLLFIAEDL